MTATDQILGCGLFEDDEDAWLSMLHALGQELDCRRGFSRADRPSNEHRIATQRAATQHLIQACDAGRNELARDRSLRFLDWFEHPRERRHPLL
jgi:hypothetical protein